LQRVTVLWRLLVALWLGLAGTAQAEPLRIAVISDLNGSYGSTDYAPRVSAAIDAIIALKPDLVLSTGDMVAGQRRPHLSDRELRAMWRAFHAAVSDPLQRAGIPLAVTPGNHDGSAYAGFAHERRIYAEEWRARRPAVAFVGGTYPFSYAFDLGDTRFVSLDATTVGPLPRDEMDGLRAMLTGGPDTRIVFSHLPIWPFAEGRRTEVIGDRAVAGLMTELGVDLHLSGHHHAFYPGAVGALAVVSQACLGSGSRALLGSREKSPHAITILDIDARGKIAVHALLGPTFKRAIAIDTLPRAINGPEQRIRRLDLSDLPDVRWGKQD
jgi:hypothetical protein